jgi:GT2 family glycosyltransferase
MRDQLELCVVDSGSSEPERQYLVDCVGPRVEKLLLRPNLGYGTCSNVGAANTHADVLLFVNPDTSVVSLPACVRDGFARNGFILGAVNRSGGRRSPTGFRAMPSARHEARQLLLGRFSRCYQPAWEDPAWVSGAALAITRDDFDQIQGFSPAIFLFFEDADLCARHREQGGRVEIDSAFVIDHVRGMGSRREYRLEGVSRWSARIYASRHDGRLHAAGLFLLFVAYYVPRRVLLTLVRRFCRRDSENLLLMLQDLLLPRRVLRKLNVPDAGVRRQFLE